MNDNFNGIDDKVVSPESTELNKSNDSLQKTANVIRNNRSTISREKSDILLGKGLPNKGNPNSDKEAISRLNNARSKNNIPQFGNSFNEETANENSTDKSSQTEIQKVANNQKEQIKNKLVGKSIQAATYGAVSSKNAEKIAMKAQKLMTLTQKRQAFLAIGVAVGFLLLILIVGSIFMNGYDLSKTISDTNRYNTGNMSDEDLIDYLSYISICPTVEDLYSQSEYYGIPTEEGITFEVVRELAAIEEAGIVKSCTNALDYYESLKAEYLENKKACYVNRDEESKKIHPNFWDRGFEPVDPYNLSELKSNPKAIDYFINHKDDYDCQIVLPTNLIYETMSYNLTDQELFVEDYLKKDNYIEYYKDHRKLANALSEFVHETCYVWKYKDPQGKAHDGPCKGCVKAKYAMDGYYFQINFSKYVCFLKYGDTCTHPNYSGLAREKYPDLKYFEHMCSGPQSDRISVSSTGGTTGSSDNNGKCWRSTSSGILLWKDNGKYPGSGGSYYEPTDLSEADCVN